MMKNTISWPVTDNPVSWDLAQASAMERIHNDKVHYKTVYGVRLALTLLETMTA